MQESDCFWKVFDQDGGPDGSRVVGDGMYGLHQRAVAAGGRLLCRDCRSVMTAGPIGALGPRLDYSNGEVCVDPRSEAAEKFLDEL